SVAVNEEGKLIITLTDDTVIDCGNVKGEQSTVGPQGPQGEQGVSIVNTAFDENGNMVITYSDGTTQVVEHNWQKLYVLEQANCQTDGKELYSCTDCGLVRVIITPQTGHTDGEWITDLEPTCTEDGSKHQVCAVCGETIKTESIDATGHSYVATVIDATCISQGYTLHTCSVCGDNYKDNYIETNGVHDFQEADTCVYCAETIENVAVDSYNMSATADDNVRGYVVPRMDGKYDVYIKGADAMKDYTSSSNPFEVDGYTLKNAYIQDGVTSICSYAFYDCSSLASITIPDGVTSIGEYAFRYCSSLTSVYITDIAYWCSISFSNYYANPFYYADNLYVDNQLVTELVIPDGVTSIGSYAFDGCGSLTSITIPDSVTSIGSSAFYNCSSLTSITIPDSVTSIGSSAFYNCSSLTSITIPDSVTSIGSSAFYNCSSLTSVTIGNSVTSIGGEAFRGCSSLTSITIPDSVTSIGSEAFYNTEYYNNTDNWQNKVLYVDNCLIEAKTTIEECVVKEGTTIIANNAFSGCNSLTSITIPDSVKSIGDYAFYNCSSLSNIAIPNSVTSIGSSAFRYCSRLTSITIPNSVTSIGSSAFRDCSSLTSITIPFVGETLNGTNNTLFGYIFGASSSSDNSRYVPSSLKSVVITGGSSIGSSAFRGCSSLTSITIPDSVTYIGEYAFYDCSRLTSITIPDSVTSIGNYAFEYCSSLTSITIPDSVTSIGRSAFYGCSSLSSVTFERNGWYFTQTEGATSGSLLDLSDASQNVTYLNSTYSNYYWYASEHSYTVVVVAPTCTEKGYTSHTCDHCGDNYVDAEIKALGHNYIAVKTPQTETTPAFTTFTCETCGHSYSVEEDAVISPVENVAILTDYGLFHNETTGSYYDHKGLDFAAEVGTEVYAIFSGTVNNIYKADILNGTEVIISCDNGYTLVYRFVEEAPGLEAGQTVVKGQVIATVAEATGNEYKLGSHLHFEILSDGKYIDPTTVLNIEEK
ncbi:MAG: leucine-rich repeat protein, partial [Clostridia bacterium]|nr:leucine-rich repeat protein [Clostridia bacterium]